MGCKLTKAERRAMWEAEDALRIGQPECLTDATRHHLATALRKANLERYGKPNAFVREQTVADFIVDRSGSIVSLTPMNQAAREWVAEHCHIEPWQWLGATFNIDARYAPDLIDGIVAAGLTIE